MPDRHIFSKHGWMTRSAQWSTDRTQAARFPLEEAINRCAAHKTNMLMAVPVSPAEMGKIK